MKKLLFPLLFGAFSALGQDFDNYRPLVCTGKIPDEFLTSSTVKAKSEAKEIEAKKLKKSERKDRKAFAVEANFGLDKLLLSGKILFNDPISIYLQTVVDALKKADPTFKKNVRVYALRSPEVNAFATDRGSIFVSLGLLAQLEDEAQLAFILSHEMAHVSEGHGADFFVKSAEIERNTDRRDVYKESTFKSQLFTKNRYSRANESEADNLGLQRFLKTDWSPQTVERVFDILKYSYLPFDEQPFERGFFESGEYVFPADYWLETVREIADVDEKEDDSKSTHPNIAARRAAYEKSLEKAKTSGKSTFLISKADFEKAQKLARFELPAVYLHDQQYQNAVYSAFLLGQQVQSFYLEKCAAKALYFRTKLVNDDDYSVRSRADSVEGESQRVFKLFEKLGEKEMTVLAVRQAWRAHIKRPDDAEMQQISDDLFVELARHFSSLDEFEKAAPEAKKDSKKADAEPKKAKSTGEKSKLDKIKEKRETASKDSVSVEKAYWKHGFDEFLSDEAFQKAFEKGQKEMERRKDEIDWAESSKGRAEIKKRRKKEAKRGLRMGIKKVVAVNPFYLKLDDRREQAVQYFATESGQEHLRTLIEKAAKAGDLKVDFLDATALGASETEKFNDLRWLNDYFSEQVDFEDLTVTPGTAQAELNAIAKKYGTDYFLWTGVISLREAKRFVAVQLILGAIYWPLLPIAVINAAKPEYDMLQYAILYDVKTGRNQTIKYDYFDSKDSDALLKSHYYDLFQQINKKD